MFKNPSIHAIWFDENNPNWTRDAASNFVFIKGVQSHLNNVLMARGVVLLNDVYDALRASRTHLGAFVGWYHDPRGPHTSHIDFGLFNNDLPDFTNGDPILLDFNIDGTVVDQYPDNPPIILRRSSSMYAIKIQKSNLALLALLNGGVEPTVETKVTYLIVDPDPEGHNEIMSERDFYNKFEIAANSPLLLKLKKPRY